MKSHSLISFSPTSPCERLFCRVARRFVVGSACGATIIACGSSTGDGPSNSNGHASDAGVAVTDSGSPVTDSGSPVTVTNDAGASLDGAPATGDCTFHGDGPPVVGDNLPVGDSLTGTFTFTKACSPYEIKKSITVQGGVLRIEPGAVLKFDHDTYIYVATGGSLDAVGTASDVITLTSAAAAPAPGDWQFVWVADAAAAKIQYVKFDFCGGISSNFLLLSPCLRVAKADAPLDHLEIDHAYTLWGKAGKAASAILLETDVEITNSTFRNMPALPDFANTRPTIALDFASLKNIGVGNTFDSNATILATNVDHWAPTTRIPNPGLPVIVAESVSVTLGPNDTVVPEVTLSPGLRLLFAPDAGFIVQGGNLDMTGDPSAHITLGPLLPNLPWNGIAIGELAHVALSYVDMSDGSVVSAQPPETQGPMVTVFAPAEANALTVDHSSLTDAPTYAIGADCGTVHGASVSINVDATTTTFARNKSGNVGPLSCP